jgi:Family of unknown function (DUF6069)
MTAATAAIAISQETPRVRRGSGDRRVRAAAVGAAGLATSLLFLAARALGTDFTITDPGAAKPPHTFILPEIAGFAVFFGLLGWGALALLERYTARARLVWTVLAATVLVLSFVPIGIEHATADTKVMLAVIHIAVAVALLPILRRDPSGPTT